MFHLDVLPFLGHGVFERGLLEDGPSVLAVEEAVAVDVEVPAGLGVPVALNGAGLGDPFELSGLRRLEGFAEGRVVPVVLGGGVDLLSDRGEGLPLRDRRRVDLLRDLCRDGPGDYRGRKPARVRDGPSQRPSQPLPAVGEELGVMGPARDGDIGHAVVEQVLGSEFGVDVDEHAASGLALAGMAGDGIPMIEVRMPDGIDLDGFPAVHRERHPAARDGLDRPQLPVGELKFGRGRGELDAVADGEGPFLLSVDGDALLPAGIVGSLGTILRDDGEPVAGSVDGGHPCVLALGYAGLLGAPAVAKDVILGVAGGPHPVGPGEVLAGHEHPRPMLFPTDHALRL